MQEQVCCLCGETFVGFGNNAYPLAEGRCCDLCNNKVILERIRFMQISDLAKMAATKVTNEVIEANKKNGKQGVEEVLKKYDLEDIKI